MNEMRNDDYDNMQKAWLDAANDLGIEIGYPFILKEDDYEYSNLFLVRHFGSSKGTLILNINGKDLNQEFLDKEGYYYSYLNPIRYRKYNKKDFMETLTDWGWYGEENKKPSWYI